MDLLEGRARAVDLVVASGPLCLSAGVRWGREPWAAHSNVIVRRIVWIVFRALGGAPVEMAARG
jgi:hypothetical protein